MEIVYFTIMAVVLYAGSDWILNQIETQRGARLPNRSLIFFVIIGILTLASFTLIQTLGESPETATSTQTAPANTSPGQQDQK